VPNSPGAADDSAGVAVALEVARALKSGPQPERDVIFLITDGEELGLLGAAAFFKRDPLVRHIGAVINMEARGDSGLTAMFETGPLNAGTVAMYAAGAPRPSADSLSRAIYKQMPNGSDFTLAAKRGLPGLNFAFIEDEAAYHTPLSTPSHLNLGSVQHMGDQVLAAARAFAAALPEQKADAVYSDVLGFFFIQYSFAVGWFLFAAAALLACYAIWAAQRLKRSSWGRGLAGGLAMLLLPSLLLWLAGYSFGDLGHFQRLAHFDFLLAGAAVLAAGAVMLVAALFVRPGARLPALWQTLLLLQLIFAGVLQAFVPEAAFVLTWPLLLAAVAAAIRFGLYRGAAGLIPSAVAALAGLIVVAMSASSAAALFTAVGVDYPLILILPLIAALPVLLLQPGSKPLPLWTHAVAILLGVVLFAYGRLAPPTPERPAPTIVRHVEDLDSGKAYRIAAFDVLDPWAKAVLGAPRYSAMPWSDGVEYWWAPAEAAAVPTSDLTVARKGDKLEIAIKTAPGAYSAVLAIRTSEALAESSLDGVKIPALKAGDRYTIQYFSPNPNGNAWMLPASRKGVIDVKLTTTYLDWPAGAAIPPPMPADYMAFGTSGGTVTIRRISWRP
jgi:hypothetical protein